MTTGREGPDGIPVLAAGESLRGTLTLVSPERIDCRGVIVRLRYLIVGKGNPEDKAVVEIAANTGAWVSGPDGAIPFDLRVPDEGPITWSGKLMDISWSVEVQPDIKWAKDPVVRLPITVVPREA